MTPTPLLARVESAIALNADPTLHTPDSLSMHRYALRAMWYFAQGIDAGGARPIEDAVRHYRQAAYCFAPFGDHSRLEQSIALGIYSEGLLRIQQHDVVEAERLLAQSQRFMENSSSMGSEQREMVASMQIEILGLQSDQALRGGDAVRPSSCCAVRRREPMIWPTTTRWTTPAGASWREARDCFGPRLR